MSEQNVFEMASRLKLRFTSTKGLLSVEDLWDLPLQSIRGTSLDTLAASYDEQKEAVKKSYVTPLSTDPVDKLAKLSFSIIMHIIKVRLEENQIKVDAKARKEKKEKLMSLISNKEDSLLEGLTIDELRKQLEEL